MSSRRKTEVAPAGGNWGRWGDDDRRGTANLAGPAQVRAAAALVRRGVPFSLALPIDGTAPRFPVRQDHHHRFTFTGTDAVVRSDAAKAAEPIGWSDDVIEMSLQGSTHWDGLGHMHVADVLYNGFWAGDITATSGDTVLGIGHQRESFVGRGVLLDLARHVGVDSLEPGQVVTPRLLEETCAAQRVAIGAGDIVLLRTGYLSRWWTLADEAQRARYWDAFPGVGAAGAAWIAAHDISATASDTVGYEVQPFEDPSTPFPVHRRFLFELGLTIGELWDLDALAADCAQDGVWEFLLVAPPLFVPNAVGSPINPIALK